MGSGWSTDEASVSQPKQSDQEEPNRTPKQHQTRANQAVSELPHNYEAIAKEADSPLDASNMDNLYNQLHAGVLLNKNRQKYWVDNKSNNNCFMLFARDLLITWSEDNRYWRWSSLQQTSEALIDVAELINVSWLEVHGRFDTAKLSPKTLYEVGLVVMIKDPAYGWDIPVNVRLSLPDGTKQQHKENLMEKARGRWIEIPVGEFRTSEEGRNGGEMEISMFEYEGGKWKKGLIIKGVRIQPKNQLYD